MAIFGRPLFCLPHATEEYFGRTLHYLIKAKKGKPQRFRECKSLSSLGT